ncbi:unnamed protein product [Effrenium voratum]|uniref:Uncharacterized protein n=1 Tax=Effrenium voratum TaxID=2562239 RepID=A0AA36JPG3_9DINO|nr:unnamed protein product [Effrenium voratum]
MRLWCLLPVFLGADGALPELPHSSQRPWLLRRTVPDLSVYKKGEVWQKLPQEKRRLQEKPACSVTADCGPNEYCMSCTKCAEYHAQLPKEAQRRWTCDPCRAGENLCESGKYCTVAHDPVGSCPTQYPGCNAHSDCDSDEYCFSCQKCEEYMQTQSANSSLWRCEPCPTSKGGFCSKQWWCPMRKDSITGSCPQEPGCGKHSDCKEGEYCESCELCLKFQQSLPASQQSLWPCTGCPTAGGGICEPARLCQMANDGIDRTCPPEKGCDAHLQCKPDEYCMDCNKCTTYRDSLPPAQRNFWPCGYCPTGRGGHCERRVFCSVANDGVTDTCPIYEGCFKHGDCSEGEFCWNWDACEEEDVHKSGNCGDKPRKDGFCNPVSTCTSKRSIDGHCRGAKSCNSHRECGRDLFCSLWTECHQRSPDICGPQPAHRDGICLPLENCVHGFHAPLGGECPAWYAHNGTRGGQLEVSEVLKLNSTLMLATFHQAMNAWRWILPHQERDLLLTHLHDYGGNGTRRDDAEYVGIFEATGGKLVQQHQVQLSCPWSEVAIPARGPRIFEARIFMDELQMSQKHSECSCILGESGRCPRGASYMVASIQPEAPPYCNDDPFVGAAPQSQKEILPQNILNVLQNCTGAVKVITQTTLILQSPGASVRFLRVDNFEIEEVSVPASGSTKLTFDGQNLRCDCELELHHECGSLHRGLNIPVVLESFNVGAEPEKNTINYRRYCTSCQPALKRLHPVFFYDSFDIALENNLTLYSLREDMVRPVQLVDSRKSPEQGEAESIHGCPWREAVNSKGHSLKQIRDANKVLPSNHMYNRWCAVQVGSCSISSKVKYCIAGGASGVLIMEAPGSMEPGLVPDQKAQVHLSSDETLQDMVPVLYSAYDEQLWNALLNGEAVNMEAGPNIGVRPASTHPVSSGGVRVYDTQLRQWSYGGGGFGAQRWMEHSQVRDVLFVCTKDQTIIALDTSRSDNILTKVGQAPDVRCSASKTLRDANILDFRRGNRFFTVFIDAEGDRNHLIFFETTSLSAWTKLSEVHASWEHETEGLGQVVVTEDGTKLLVTWQCSTIHCGNARRIDGSAPGEHVYVLDLTAGLEKGYVPPVLAAIKLPMSEGSIVRDIECNEQNLCLASLSWDGVVVLDMAEGPNRFKVVAQHSASFAGWQIGGDGDDLSPDLSYLRMVAGAQKVIASRSRPNRFYIERWSFDMPGWSAGNPIDSSLRFDSIWAVDVDHYVRPSFDSGVPPQFDPAVSAAMHLPAVAWASVYGRQDQFKNEMAESLQVGLGIDGSRVVVTAARPAKSEGTMIQFTLLDGLGPSPETLFNALWRQLLSPNSALMSGQAAQRVKGASMQRIGPLPISYDTSQQRLDSGHDGEQAGLFRLTLGFLTLSFILLGGLMLWYLVRSKHDLRRIKEENRVLKERQRQGHREAVGFASGYVIGRPNANAPGATGPKDPDAQDAAGSLSFVVGNPVAAQGACNALAPSDEQPAASSEDSQVPSPSTVRASTRLSGTELP